MIDPTSATQNGLPSRPRSWLPLACEFLCLRNLRVGHPFCCSLSGLYCIFVTVHGRQFEPLVCLYKILRDALAIGVCNSEIILSRSVTLVGCQPRPLHRLGVVLRHALTVGVRKCEGILSCCGALLCGEPGPFYCLGGVLRHAPAVDVHVGK